MKFWVRVLKVNDAIYPWTLHDGAIMIRDGLRDLGHEAYFDNERQASEDERQIIIGGNHGTLATLAGIPNGSIVYQLEQSGCAHHFTPTYLRLLRRCVVWDYHPYNIVNLVRSGIRGIFVPFSYVKSFTPLEEKPAEQDFDVLFIGAINPFRAKIMRDLWHRGLKVYMDSNCFGDHRDDMLRRSKLVVNIHYYQTNKILESCRLGIAMAARRPVLSQFDPGVRADPFFVPGIAIAPYKKIVETAARLLSDPTELSRLADAGFELFKSRTAASVIEQALAKEHV